jgi:hypothetical protein
MHLSYFVPLAVGQDKNKLQIGGKQAQQELARYTSAWYKRVEQVHTEA